MIPEVALRGRITYTGCTTGGGPHAVCQVDGGPAYSYDSNGNMTSGNGHTVTYTAFNKVSHMEGTASTSGNSSPTVDFVYGADGNRVVQITGTTAGSETARTVYVGLGETGKSIYERTSATTGIQHVHFVYAGSAHQGNAFALRIATQTSLDSAATYSTKYNHFDHLGSTTATSDESGQVIAPAWGGAATSVYSYDAWGLKRSPDGRPATANQNPVAGNREYTGQESIPGVTLVNMNGRVYDPELGRFLSPDPNVQFVADLQNYNRYSYVRNNPLRYTDPTGYAWYSFVSNPQFWMSAIETFAMVGCTVSTAGGCGGLALAFMIQHSVAMYASGASLWQVAAVDAVGYFAGAMGGQLGGAVAGNIGGGLGRVLGGAAGGAVSAAITTEVYGGKNLGTNILAGALSGAATAGLTLALQGQNPLSIADQREQQGDFADDSGHGSARDRLGMSTDEAPENGRYAGDRRAIRELDRLESGNPEYEYSAKITGDKRGLNFDETKWGRYPDTGGDPDLPDPTRRAPTPPAGPAGHYEFGDMHNHLSGEDFSVRDITTAVSNGKVIYMEGPAGLVLRFDPSTDWVVPIRSSVDPFDPVATPYMINRARVIQP